MVNRRPQACNVCGAMVPTNGGHMWKRGRRWLVAHLTCLDEQAPRVVEFYFPSTGSSMIQNAHGRCEDAPCCGCCS